MSNIKLPRVNTKLLILNHQLGLTIIELLVIIVIISTIGILSISFYSRFLNQNSVKNTQNQIVGSLRKAQIYSMMGKQGGTWGVKYESNKITLYLSNNNAFDESFDINNNVTIYGFTNVLFAKTTGLPNTTGDITISSAIDTKKININSQGVVSKIN